MRKVVFTSTAQERITHLYSPHFTAAETMAFQINLTQTILSRLMRVHANEGYKEYVRGPWSRTRRFVIEGYRVYYELNEEKDLVIIKAIKARGMR